MLMPNGAFVPSLGAWQHPTAYGSLVGDPPIEQSVEAISLREGAVAALSTLTHHRLIASHQPDSAWSSADLRLLCVHFLIRKVHQRIDHASLYEITDKGRDVLAAMR